jgi:hypothetical protein
MDQCFSVIKKTIQDSSALCYISKSQIPSWKKYIEFTEDFCKIYNYDQDLFALNVKKTAIEPLLKYKRDCEIYVNTCRQIAAALNQKKSVTKKAVLYYMGVVPKTPPLKTTIEMTPATPRIVLKNKHKSDIAFKNESLINCLDPPIVQALRDIMEREGLDNEYAALSRAVKNELKRGDKK